jgi:5-formyltetrahydrofolate cyclo-ligase
LDKKLFRDRCKSVLKKASEKKRYIHDIRVCQKVDSLIKATKPKSVLFYAPLKSEPNLLPLVKKYRKKIDVYLPFIEEKSFKMVKYRLPLKKCSFNVYEPKNSSLKVKSVDMIIVPVVGVDGDFKRVGFGKGMYDRFYERLDKKPMVVFVQRKRCFTKQKVTSCHDISCDFYITPS